MCVQIKSFKDYVDMYLKEYPPGDDDEDLPRKVVHEVVNPRWEVCITVSPSGFQQASFVNSIATTKVRDHFEELMGYHSHACADAGVNVLGGRV